MILKITLMTVWYKLIITDKKLWGVIYKLMLSIGYWMNYQRVEWEQKKTAIETCIVKQNLRDLHLINKEKIHFYPVQYFRKFKA